MSSISSNYSLEANVHLYCWHDSAVVKREKQQAITHKAFHQHQTQCRPSLKLVYSMGSLLLDLRVQNAML